MSRKTRMNIFTYVRTKKSPWTEWSQRHIDIFQLAKSNRLWHCSTISGFAMDPKKYFWKGVLGSEPVENKNTSNSRSSVFNTWVGFICVISCRFLQCFEYPQKFLLSLVERFLADGVFTLDNKLCKSASDLTWEPDLDAEKSISSENNPTACFSLLKLWALRDVPV